MIFKYHITKEMGFLDNIFKKEKQMQEQAQVPEERKVIDQYTIPSREDKEKEIYIQNIERQGTIRHSNNELTQLIMAKITKYGQGDTIYFDYFDYIGFEIPSGQTLDANMIKAIMYAYDMSAVGSKARTYYMGRLMQDGPSSYRIGNKSAAVEKMVLDIVEKSEQAKRKENEAILKAREVEKQAEEAKFKEELRRSAREYEEKVARTRNERKQSPTLRQGGISRINGKVYESYDGVNLNTGDILRMRKVDKVGKDVNGTYLYSAYLDTVLNEYDAEFVGEEVPAGVPVCFTLPGRLSDMVQDRNNKDIQNILNLLSGINTKSPKNKQQLNYLGGITQDGNISYAEMGESTPLGRKIMQMKEEYKKELEARNLRQEEQKGN